MPRVGCLAAVALLALAVRCYGHGTPILVNGSSQQLIVGGGLADTRGYAGMVFADADEEAVLVPAPGGVLLSTLPGFQISGMGEGESIALEALARPDFADESSPLRWLWYWDPQSDALGDVPNNSNLEIASARLLGSSVFLEQEVATVPASVPVAILGADDIDQHRHLLFYILEDAPAAPGVYGFFARLTSPAHEPSTPFLIALNHGIDVATFQEGALQINSAARMPGDYDGDDDVDGADLLVWQRTYGSTSQLGADGSRNAAVDGDDLEVWRDNFGQTPFAQLPTTAPVPEPAAVILALLGLLGAASLRTRRPAPMAIQPTA